VIRLLRWLWALVAFWRRWGPRPARPGRAVAPTVAARGKVWATLGFVLGIAVSVAGNVAYTSYPTKVELEVARAAGETWSAPIGAHLIAAFFPLALLVTVEVLARVPWPRTLGMSAARWGGAALVAGVAGIVSYNHLNGLLRVYGEDHITARLGPLSVDGLMVVCGFALIAIGKHTATAPAPGRAPAVVVAESTPAALETPALADVVEGEHPAPDVPVDVDPMVPEVRRRFAKTLAAGSVPSARQIKREMRVGHPRAAAIRTALGGQ
jgi:hypothetical protein